MAIEILTLSASLLLCTASIITSFLTLRLLKSIGTGFFRYTFAFFVFVTLWSTSFIVPSLLFDAQFHDFVLNWIYVFSPFGYLALSFMIAAMESVKGDERTFAKNGGFLIVGGLISGLYIPDTFQLVWAVDGWIHEYTILYEIGRGILFILVMYSMLPLVLRVFNRLRISMRKDYHTPALFWIIVIVLPFILLIQPFRQIAPIILQPLFHSSIMMLMVTVFLLMLANLFYRHPIILFVGSHDIEELYVIRRDSVLPMYHYSFVSSGMEGATEILSAFFTGIKHYVKHSLGSGEIQQIQVGDYELNIHEGLFTYGILIAKRSSKLAKNLLRLFIEEFESSVGYQYVNHVEPQKYQAFDRVVSRFFEFAIVNTELIH
ncbi:MAG: hypothetical protein P1Q69_09460 [Candidatus Thorarchaeota archaeon]|nr:hypothetical protein [Candidatus Thorarchaeota archaeon]